MGRMDELLVMWYWCNSCGWIVFFKQSLIEIRLCIKWKPEGLLALHGRDRSYICNNFTRLVGNTVHPSHHWASLGFHFAGLNPISLVGLSRWPGEGRYPQHINWSRGFLGDRFLDPSSSPHTLHHWVPSYKHMASPIISMLMTALSLISTRWSNGSCTHLRLPGGHLGVDERASPTAQPGKDWASCLPCHSDSKAWFHQLARFFYN